MPRLICLLSFLAFSGCTRIGLFTVNLIADARGVRRTADVAYGSEIYQKLNIYRDKNSKVSELKPVIVFFYGGDWSSGDKNDYDFVAEAFTAKGFLVVIPDYSKYPAHRYPDFMVDAAKSVAWTYKNIENYGGNRNEVFLMGHSCGAFISTLLVTNKNFLKEQMIPSAIVLGGVGLSGPYDFVPGAKKYQEIFESAGVDAKSAMPATYIDGTQPPILLIHGLKDDLIDFYNVTRMQDKIKKYGGELECKLYPDVSHNGTIAALAAPLRGQAETLKDVINFLEKILKQQQISM